MVQSKINTDVSYKEKNDIHKKDDEMEAFLYSYPILGFDCTISLASSDERTSYGGDEISLA